MPETCSWCGLQHEGGPECCYPAAPNSAGACKGAEVAVLAVDPGPDDSGWVLWDGITVQRFGTSGNAALLCDVSELLPRAGDTLVLEEIASYGMPVGREVFQTVRWAGRFEQRAVDKGRSVCYVLRRTVKLHLCGEMRAKDGHIRQALIDRFGGKDKAIGKKHSPGPLYGVTGDCWQALALAVTFWDQRATVVGGG